jgi:hypothetical protein
MGSMTWVRTSAMEPFDAVLMVTSVIPP